MSYLYAVIKYFTILGTLSKAALVQGRCKKHGVPVEDARTLKFNEMCGHIEHELPKSYKVASIIALRPLLLLFIIGSFILVPASIQIFYVGDLSVFNFLLLWVGISLWTNLFPSVENALNVKHLSGNKKFRNFIGSILVFGAKLERTGLSLVTSLLAAAALPQVIKLIAPALYKLFS